MTAGELKERISFEQLLSRLGIDVDRSGFVPSPVNTGERTPSCKIYFKDNYFKDYSGGGSGSIIDFYMQLYRVDFPQACNEIEALFFGNNSMPAALPSVKRRDRGGDFVSSLSEEEKEFYFERCGIADERTANREVRLQRLKTNIKIFEEMQSYCIHRGWDTDAYLYMIKKRRFNPETLKHFGYFSIKNYSEVNNHLKKVFKLADLQRSGLYNTKKDGSGNLIFFKHKIIIPYYHRFGDGFDRVVYLRGRYFDETEKVPADGKTSKYLGLGNDGLRLNSPKRFYNYPAVQRSIAGDKVYITEGEFDAAAVWQLGYNAIAIPGAGNMPDICNWMALKNLNCVYLGDEDKAGTELLEKLKEIFNRMGKSLFEKHLPVGTKDVNDFIAIESEKVA